MTKLKTIALTVLALVLPLPSLAQTDKAWFETPEGFFKNSPQVLRSEQMIAAASKGRGMTNAATEGGTAISNSFTPPLASLITSGDIAFRGEEYNASLIFKGPLPQSVYVYGRLLFPNQFGQQGTDSRVEYFSALSGDGSGRFRRGFADGDLVPVFSQKIMGNYNAGDYMLEIGVVDENGRLLYGAFSRFSVTARSHQVSDSYFYVSSSVRMQFLKFTSGHRTTYLVELSGRFPQNQPLDITASLPGIPRFDAIVVSTNGTSLRFVYETPPVYRPSVLDLTVYSDFFREAITLRHGLDLDAAIQITPVPSP